MAKPVIVAIDPHRDDPAPAALGILLARATAAPLVLASAYAFDPQVDRLYPEYVQAMRSGVEQGLARLRAEVQERAGASVAVSATAIADAGSPASALQRLATQKDAGVIVIGSSARGLAGRVLPGAVTDRLLHGAPCAVAVAPVGFGSGPTALELIGVAFVDRPDGRAALAAGCDLARTTGGSVRVLTVREPTDWRYSGAFEPELLAVRERARDHAAEVALETAVGAVPDARSAGGELLTGRAQDALAAASEDLDLLVCGSRGYGPVRTLVLGGVAHALVRRAVCPVLVVPRPDATEAVAGADSTLAAA